jgi:ACR3 family arsenite efflux pump ArsB
MDGYLEVEEILDIKNLGNTGYFYIRRYPYVNANAVNSYSFVAILLIYLFQALFPMLINILYIHLQKYNSTAKVLGFVYFVVSFNCVSALMEFFKEGISVKESHHE